MVAKSKNIQKDCQIVMLNLFQHLLVEIPKQVRNDVQRVIAFSAIHINIEIMRTFAHYRSVLRENEELKKQITQVDNKVDKAFNYLLERIDELHYKKLEIEPIGYKLSEQKT